MERERKAIPTGLPKIRAVDLEEARRQAQASLQSSPDRRTFTRTTFARMHPLFTLVLTGVSRGLGLDAIGDQREMDKEAIEEFKFGAAYFYRIVEDLRNKGYTLPDVTTSHHLAPIQRRESPPTLDINDIDALVAEIRNTPQKGSEPLDFTPEEMLAENPELRGLYDSLPPLEQRGTHAVYTLIRNQYLSDQLRSAIDE
jgi:hypothetical protein